jgi:hypothetical protein
VDLQVVVKAATALGYVCAGDSTARNLDAALTAMFELSVVKKEEVQFAVGEALCFIFGGAAAAVRDPIGSQGLGFLVNPKPGNHEPK